MENWEIQILKDTFKRCYGLHSAIIKAFEGKDTSYKKECLKTLANQSGMRVDFLTNNIKEILQNGKFNT